MRVPTSLAVLAVVLAWSAPAAGAEPCPVSKDGRSLQRVVIGAKASDRTRAAAKNLAAYLGRITGGTFQVADGEGDAGLAVGRPEDFPKLKLADKFKADDV